MRRGTLVVPGVILLVLVACSSESGPSRSQIEEDLRNRIPNYVTAACGCAGGPTVDAIKRASATSAIVTVTAGGLMCPEATCDVRVRYRYVREQGAWSMAMPLQGAETVEAAPTTRAAPTRSAPTPAPERGGRSAPSATPDPLRRPADDLVIFSVKSSSPARGSKAGGTLVEVRGEGFAAPNARDVHVYFGERRAELVRIDGDQVVVVKSPAGAAGEQVDITVGYATGQSFSLPHAFTYE